MSLGPVLPAGRLTYSPGLDGLRAVAAVAVMLFHLRLFHMTGGFLGVDVFFTLSGFLITSLLLEELRVLGRIDLRGFWRRRVFRIVPLLATVSGVWAVWAAFDHSAMGHRTLVGAATSALFMTNWLVMHDGLAAGLLNGNWSVAFEEQFYLTWPLILGFLWRRVRSEKALAYGLASLVGLVMLHRWLISPGAMWFRVSFGPDTQIDAVLAGCAVALGLRCRSKGVSIMAGIALIGFLFVGRQTQLLTAQLIMPATVVCTALLLPYLQEHGGVLRWSPLVALGKRSYGFYLWGGPIAYQAEHSGHLTGLALLAATFGVTMIVTEVTYRLIETPLRRRGRSLAGKTAQSHCGRQESPAGTVETPFGGLPRRVSSVPGPISGSPPRRGRSEPAPPVAPAAAHPRRSRVQSK